MLTIEDLQGNRKQRRAEIVTRRIFQAAALFSILVSLLIVFVLVQGTWDFFVGIDWNLDVLTDTGWFPRRERFALRTIVVGSIVVGSIAMLVAAPLGLGVAIYLAEYARPKVRAVVKPVIELLAGLPSVVVGFFALKFIAPEVVDRIFDPTQSRNMLVAGLGIGI